MGDLSEHFSKAEFRCKDGSEHPIDPKLIEMLEQVRAHFNAPVRVVSGYRSPEYNRRVGGVPNSYHTRGMAADIQVDGVGARQVAAWASKTFQTGGVGSYPTFTHIDSRPGVARWRK